MVSDSQIDRIKNIKLGVCIMKENVKERKRTRLYRVWHTDKKSVQNLTKNKFQSNCVKCQRSQTKVLEMFRHE